MSDQPRPTRSLLTAAEIRDGEFVFSHPWNPSSLVHFAHLSGLSGLKRTGVSLVRIPPGKESFCYHMHHREEEWVYLLSGHATAEIGDEAYAVGPGDFLAFPAGGEAHLLRNTGEDELVCLMGGENRQFEIADFPRLGKRMVRMGEKMEIFELADAEPFEVETS